MQQITPDQVLAELAHHKGQAKGIHVKALVMAITGQLDGSDAQERAVRKLVNDLRMEGNPICAHPAHGYYLAETHAELEQTCNFLRSRALSSLKAYSRLRRISATQLLGPKADMAETNPLTTTEEENYDER